LYIKILHVYRACTDLSSEREIRSDRLVRMSISAETYPKEAVEPSEVQYLVINALETLNLLIWRLYDEDTGHWHIQTPSNILPLASVLQDGEVVPFGED